MQHTDEDALIEQLCSELLPTPCSSCSGATAAAPSPAAAAAAAAAVTAALLPGSNAHAQAALPALAALFPAASGIVVTCPTTAGTAQLPLLLLGAPGGAGAAARSTAALPLGPVLNRCGRCTLTSAAAIGPAEQALLAAFAADLGRCLSQALKEQHEVRAWVPVRPPAAAMLSSHPGRLSRQLPGRQGPAALLTVPAPLPCPCPPQAAFDIISARLQLGPACPRSGSLQAEPEPATSALSASTDAVHAPADVY